MTFSSKSVTASVLSAWTIIIYVIIIIINLLSFMYNVFKLAPPIVRLYSSTLLAKLINANLKQKRYLEYLIHFT